MINYEEQFREGVKERAKILALEELQRRIENCRGYSKSPSTVEMVKGIFIRKLTFTEMDAISSQVYQLELNKRLKHG